MNYRSNKGKKISFKWLFIIKLKVKKKTNKKSIFVEHSSHSGLQEQSCIWYNPTEYRLLYILQGALYNGTIQHWVLFPITLSMERCKVDWGWDGWTKLY